MRVLVSTSFAATLLATACTSSQSATPVIGLDRMAMEARRLTGETILHRPGGYNTLEVLVVVAPDGRVLDTRPGRLLGENRPQDIAAARAAAAGWRFRPIRFRGRAVTAIGAVEVTLLPSPPPPLGPADPKARFPAAPPGDVHIMLERGECYGTCPAYKVEVDGSGAVLFTSEGAGAVRVDAFQRMRNPSAIVAPGVHRSRVAPEAVARLVDQFRSAYFFGLRALYRAEITDSPTYVLTFRAGTTVKRVKDYVGEEAGMPAAVKTLEDAVDLLAGTERWIKGNAATPDALAAEGFDFASPAAQLIAFYGVVAGSDGLLEAMARHGLPLGSAAKGLSQPDRPLGAVLILAALRCGRPAAFALLRDGGWLARLNKAELSEAFAAGGGGDPAMAAAVVAAGADPAARDGEGHTVLINALRDMDPQTEESTRRRIGMIASLVRLGVPVNAVDKEGMTALLHAQSYETVQALLDVGARADLLDRNGRSAALMSWDDRTVVTLLEAGASPLGSDPNGRTLRQTAVLNSMPATLAWLDAHHGK